MYLHLQLPPMPPISAALVSQIPVDHKQEAEALVFSSKSPQQVDTGGIDHINRLFAKSKNNHRRQNVAPSQTQPQTQPQIQPQTQPQSQPQSQPPRHLSQPLQPPQPQFQPVQSAEPVARSADNYIPTIMAPISDVASSSKYSALSRPEVAKQSITRAAAEFQVSAVTRLQESPLSETAAENAAQSSVMLQPDVVAKEKSEISRQSVAVLQDKPGELQKPMVPTAQRNHFPPAAVSQYRSTHIQQPPTPGMGFFNSSHPLHLQQQQQFQHQFFQHQQMQMLQAQMQMQHSGQNAFAIQRGPHFPMAPMRQATNEQLQYLASLGQQSIMPKV